MEKNGVKFEMKIYITEYIYIGASKNQAKAPV